MRLRGEVFRHYCFVPQRFDSSTRCCPEGFKSADQRADEYFHKNHRGIDGTQSAG
jgi:hypothetical protein